MKNKTNIKQLITTLLTSMNERKKWILALSCIVVFCTTYFLILPAFTLDKEEASEQGGIDVPGVEQSAEAEETTEDLAESSSEDIEKEETAEASSEDIVKEETDKQASDKSYKKETSKSDEKKKSADITIENDESDDFSVAVESKEAVLSEDMSVAVREIDKSDKNQKKEYDSLYNDALEAVQKAQEEEGQEKPSDFAFAKFYDISLMDGDTEVEPEAAVDVKISFGEDLQKELKVADPKKVHIVHFVVDKDSGEVTPEVLDTKSTDITVENKKVTEAAFTTDSFSVFAVVYTVDFHYEIDGKKYDCTLPGGGFISIKSLIEALNVSDNSDTFIQNIKTVKFSNPDLVWVGKVEEETTVGDLKEANGLKVKYSKELTKEKIEEINAQAVHAGDWALISLKPFDSEESLTVTMNNGEQFVIKVTDAQDPLGLDGQSFEIIVNNKALNPVKDTETIGGVDYDFLNDANPSSGSALAWKFEFDPEAFDGDGGYYISHDGKYLKMVGDNSNDPNRTVAVVDSKADATPINVNFNQDTGKYSFSNDKDASKGFLCHFNNDYFGIDGNASNNSVWMELRSPSNPSVPGFVSPWDVLGDNIKIKLFDYTGKVNGSDIDSKWASGNGSPSAQNYRDGDGVNKGRTLLFTGSGRNDANDPYNYYTGSSPGVMQGIVYNHLGDDGYPELTDTVGSKGASLGYLFGAGGQDGVTAYTGDGGNGLAGLLRKDEEGYYYFSSEQNYATLVGNEIKLYSESYEKDSPSENAKKIGFFPFDPYRKGESKAGEEKGPNGSPYNHQFGMTLESNFVLPPGGKLPNGDDMVFKFSGDDDVWVFVDNVLVLDLGGVHQPLSGNINFAGEGYSEVADATVEKISGQTTVGSGKTLAELFEAAGEEWDDSPYSTHTIKFYYLERGGCDSNCTIKFNLLSGLTDEELAKYKNKEFTYDIFVNGEPYTGHDTIRYDSNGAAIEEGFQITNGEATLKPGEKIMIIGLQPKDKVYAVEKSVNMKEFYPPKAERFYRDDKDTEHEEEIDLIEEQIGGSDNSDWKTEIYSVNNTNEIMFTNTLCEKNLDVEKKWSDGADKHTSDVVKFKVTAKIKDGDKEIDYKDVISAIYSDKNVKDRKVADILNETFTLSDANDWKAQLEHLPAVTNSEQEIFYDIEEIQTASGYSSSVTNKDSHNIDVVKIFPEDHTFTGEEIKFKLRKGTEGNYQYYNADNGTWDSSSDATIQVLDETNHYTWRFHDMPAGNYSVVEVDSDDDNPNTEGLSLYDRKLKKFEILNSPFSITVEKKWDPEELASQNIAGRKVEVTLGRYVLLNKEGNLKITKTGVPAGADFIANYTVKNTDTNEVFGVYPYIPGGITITVPEGNYSVTESIVKDDDTYIYTHGTPSTKKITIADGDTSGKEVKFTSEYSPKMGKIQVKSSLKANGTGVSYEGVTYEIYDKHGNRVEDVAPITFTEASREDGKTVDIKIGNYTVREVGAPDVPGLKATLKPKKPDNGPREVGVSVKAEGDPATAEFSATYKKNIANIHVTSTKNNVNISNNTDFSVGDTIRIEYRRNNGETINLPSVTGGTLLSNNPVEDVAPGNGNGWNGTYHVDVRITDHNLTVKFTNNGINNGWSAMDPSNVKVTRVSSNSLQSAPRMLLRAPKLTKSSGYETEDATNSANPPTAPEGKKYVEDTSFAHDVITLQYGGWSQSVSDLPSTDKAGNPYYYYIKSVHEENMPEGTTAAIRLNGENLLMVGSDNADTPLDVTNTVDLRYDLDVLKVDSENHETKLENAVFKLYMLDEKQVPGNQIKYKDNTVYGTATTDENGHASLENIALGYYEIKETQAPDGYVITGEDAFYIKVGVDGIKLLQKDMTKKPEEWAEIPEGDVSNDGIVCHYAATVIGDTGETSASATVINTPGVELPHTGGAGTTIFYILGAILVIASGIYFISRRRIIN